MTIYYKGIDGNLYAFPVMILANGHPIASTNPQTGQDIHYCDQCHEDMKNEWILGPVCGKCTRKNHRKVTGAK